MNKKLLIGLSTLIFVGLLVWLFMISNKPLPGIEAKQDGRDHIPEGSKVNYNYNPPTSGNHYVSWITKGFYEEPRPDGNIVHSMEHGYVIIWYDCEKKVTGYRIQVTDTVYAQGLPMTGGSEGSPSAMLKDMPKAFSDGSCSELKNQIKSYIDKDTHKLIAMPRVGMDSKIILTSWGRVEKMDNLDEKRVKEFIDAFRDHGPEATNEP